MNLFWYNHSKLNKYKSVTEQARWKLQIKCRTFNKILKWSQSWNRINPHKGRAD